MTRDIPSSSCEAFMSITLWPLKKENHQRVESQLTVINEKADTVSVSDVRLMMDSPALIHARNQRG